VDIFRNFGSENQCEEPSFSLKCSGYDSKTKIMHRQLKYLVLNWLQTNLSLKYFERSNEAPL